MKKVILFIIPILLIGQFLMAGEGGVEIRPAGDEIVEVESRSIATVVFKVINSTDKKRELIPCTVLPEGWRLVAADFPFELGPGEADIRLVSFLVPQKIGMGQYEVAYSVEDRGDPSVKAFCTTSVVVPPVRKLEVKWLESPDYVIAGEGYESFFAIINEGNIETTVFVEVESDERLPFTLDADRFYLGPGDSIRVRVHVSTSANFPEKIRHSLRITARVDGHEEVNAKAQCAVEIIPMAPRGESWHKIPSILNIKQVYKRGENQIGFLGSVSGRGFLDEGGKHNISFLLKLPGFPETTLLPEEGTYKIGYWTERYELYLGDRSYFLTPLTMTPQTGRGGEWKLNAESCSLGGYYMQTRPSAALVTAVAVYMDYVFNDKNSIGFNYLKKQDEGTSIVSMEGQFEPYNAATLDFEYATGVEKRVGDAYLLRLGADRDWLSYLFELRHADPGYPGSSRDMDSFSCRFVLPIGGNMSLTAGFRQEKHNLNLNQSLSSASYTEGYNLGFYWNPDSKTSLSTGLRVDNRKDLLTPPDYNSRKIKFDLSISKTFGQLNIGASIGAENNFDFLNSRDSFSGKYTYSTTYKPSDNQSYKFWLNHNTESLIGTVGSYTSAGLDCFFQLWPGTSLRTHLKTYYYEQLHSLGGGNLGLEFTHTFANRSTISLQGNYDVYRDPGKENKASLTINYKLPLEIPVSRRKSIGTVSGRVYCEETNEGIPNVIVRLDSAMAVTNRDGRFRFPAVKTGICYLHINISKAKPGLIATQRMPIELTVEGARETIIEVGVTTPASLRGQITLYHFEKQGMGDFTDTNGSENLLPDYGLAGTMLELKSGSEIKRVLTNSNGFFEFLDLQPGKWTLKISKDELPEYHYFEQALYDFNLIPGQNEEILVKVLPQKRRIQILGEEIILE